jgi:phosphoglycolate phosphatase
MHTRPDIRPAIRPEAPAEYPAGEAAQDALRLRGLLFDKDGTLFDFHGTWGVWSLALIERLARGNPARARALARALDFDLETARFRKSSPVIAGTMEVLVRAVTRTLPEMRPDGLRRQLIRSAADVRPIEATPLAPLLDQLRAAGFALGVATNDAEEPTRAQLAEVGVLDRFDFVAGYDSGYGAKPGTGMHQAFCRERDLMPAEVAMIGDSTHDLHSGRAAGMVTVAVLTGPADAEDLAPHADAVLAHIGHLPDWLDRRAGG